MNWIVPDTLSDLYHICKVEVRAWDMAQNEGVSSSTGYFSINDPTTDAKEPPDIPSAFALQQNIPNPFNPTTTIRFDLPGAINVKLCIYNVKGEFVSTIVDQHMTGGRKVVTWNGKDRKGCAVSSGIYFYRLVAGDFVETKKMVLLR